MLKLTTTCILLLAISACTTPPKKPLNSSSIAKIERINVYIQADSQGVGMQYPAYNAAGLGGQFGLIGSLAGEAIEEAVNDKRMAALQDSAARLVAGVDLNQVEHIIQTQLNTRLSNHPLMKKTVTVTTLDAKQALDAITSTSDHTLTIKFEYFIELDQRALIVVGTAYLFDAQTNRNAPPTPLNERKLLYRNRFEYHSDQLSSAPMKSNEEIATSIKALRTKYPRARSDDQQFLAHKNAMKEARLQPSAAEQANYRVKQWLADDAFRLRLELSNGIGGVLDLLSSDILDSRKANTKTSTNKPEKIVVDKKTNRELVRFTRSPFTGALSSQPLDYVEPQSTGILYIDKLRAKNAQGDTHVHGAPHTR